MTHPLFGSHRPLVAILRGIAPGEAAAVFDVLVEAGVTLIEVPLNSPEPFVSIETMAKRAAGRARVGAGTVLTPEQVASVKDSGGTLVVSPNADAAVIRRSKELGLSSFPGVFTPTEAFQAIAAGASALKFFPAGVLGVSGIGAMKAVLPGHVPVGVVGGVSEADFVGFSAIGVRTFGLGSSLYKAGMTAGDVAARGRAAIERWDAVFGGGITA